MEFLPGSGVNAHIKFKRFNKVAAEEAMIALLDVEDIMLDNGYDTLYTFAYYNSSNKEESANKKTDKFVKMLGFVEIGSGKLDGDLIVFYKKELVIKEGDTQ